MATPKKFGPFPLRFAATTAAQREAFRLEREADQKADLATCQPPPIGKPPRHATVRHNSPAT